MDLGAMDANGDDRGRARRSDDALDRWLLATASLLEGIPDAVVAAAGDGRIVFVNSLAEGLFGYRRDELIGAQGASCCATRCRLPAPLSTFPAAPRSHPTGRFPSQPCASRSAPAMSSSSRLRARSPTRRSASSTPWPTSWPPP